MICTTQNLLPPNPVHSHSDGTWWFYEETWADENGPYTSEIECIAKLESYCREVLEVLGDK